MVPGLHSLNLHLESDEDIHLLGGARGERMMKLAGCLILATFPSLLAFAAEEQGSSLSTMLSDQHVILVGSAQVQKDKRTRPFRRTKDGRTSYSKKQFGATRRGDLELSIKLIRQLSGDDLPRNSQITVRVAEGLYVVPKKSLVIPLEGNLRKIEGALLPQRLWILRRRNQQAGLILEDAVHCVSVELEKPIRDLARDVQNLRKVLMRHEALLINLISAQQDSSTTEVAIDLLASLPANSESTIFLLIRCLTHESVSVRLKAKAFLVARAKDLKSSHLKMLGRNLAAKNRKAKDEIYDLLETFTTPAEPKLKTPISELESAKAIRQRYHDLGQWVQLYADRLKWHDKDRAFTVQQ